MTDPNGANPRLRRLVADHQAMQKLVSASPLLRMTVLGRPPHRYRAIFNCKGIARDPDTGRLIVNERHIADIYLHVDYPRLPPNVVWRTAIFHPNIKNGSAGGAVCLPIWDPRQSLAEFMFTVGRMIQYQEYDTTYALNPEAARWAEEHRGLLPVDERPIIPGSLLAELRFQAEAAL